MAMIESELRHGSSSHQQSRQFANFDVVVQSWYVAARAKKLASGRAKTVNLLGRKIVLWRDTTGRPHAMDARCPHLGADLGQGQVIGDCLRCPFHHWTYDAAGKCITAPGHETPPGRSTRRYPVVERYGLIWLFNGASPHFDLPGLPDEDAPDAFRRLLPPSQHINCHPDLVIGNGLDAAHFEALHGVTPTRTPILEQPDERTLSLLISGRPRSRLLAFLTGSRQRGVNARFTTIEAGLAWLTVTAPLRFHVLFSARPSEQRGCETQVVLFLPRGFGVRMVQSILLLYSLLHDDRRILERLEFHRGFTETDEPLRRYAELIDRMEVA